MNLVRSSDTEIRRFKRLNHHGFVDDCCRYLHIIQPRSTDYLTITMAEPEGDAVAGLDVQDTIFSLSSTPSLSPSAQTDLMIYPDFKVSPLNEPVFGVRGNELPPDIDDFQFLPLYPDPWHGLGLADIDFTLDFDLESHERLWEKVMAPVEDSPGCQKTYSPFDYGSPSPLSVTHRLPIEVAVAENLNSTTDLNFVAPLPLLDVGIREPATPWGSFWPQGSPSASSTFLSQPSPKSRINSVSTTPCSPSMSPILCSWEECDKTFFTNAAFK